MFRDEYRREMDQVIWTEEQKQRLRQVMDRPNSRPRRLTRRMAAAAAVAAALIVSAVAAGTSVWQRIQERQGPFAGIAQTIEGAVCADQGIEVQVLSAVADDVRSEIYFTVRDTAGDRLDDQLTLSPAEDSDISGDLIEYDPESHTALFRARLTNYSPQTDTGSISMSAHDIGEGWVSGDTRLSLEGMTTCRGNMDATVSCAGVTDRALASQPLGANDKVVRRADEGGDTGGDLPAQQVVLAPNQTPMALEGTRDMTISSMGFASDGRFHIRVQYAQGIDHDDVLSGDYLSVQVYPKDVDQRGADKYWNIMAVTLVEGGVDYMFPLVKAGEAGTLDEISFYGIYRRPGIEVAGHWSVDFQVDYHPSKVLSWTGKLAGRTVDHVTVSPMTVTMDSNDAGGFNAAPIYAVLRDGTTVAASGGTDRYANVSSDPGVDVWDAYNTWEFERPVEVADIAYLTLLGEKIPVS